MGFCEIEPYCQKVLRKHWPDVPIYDDVRELKGETVGPVDIITGGYPCQPFSVAGKRRGEADDRHLWPEFARLIRELRPRWVLGENVAGHINMGLDEVLADLEGLGYRWEAFVIPACAVDAPHRRFRVWIVANRISSGVGANAGAQSRTEEEREELQQEDGQALSGDSEKICADVAYADSERRRETGSSKSGGRISGGSSYVADTNEQGSQGHRGLRERTDELASWPGDWTLEETWLAQSGMGRVAHGIPKRVDRLRGLGNAIVPQVAEVIMRAINSAQTEQ